MKNLGLKQSLGCAALVLLALGGCNKNGAPAGEAEQPGQTAPMINAGLVAQAGRLVLPAVKANPGAVYFTLVNQGAHDVTVTGVAIAGAQEAMMHETSGETMKMLDSLTVPKGGSVVFAPGGKHVMVFGIGSGLVAGKTTTATLSTREAGDITAELKITTAADVAADHGGHKM